MKIEVDGAQLEVVVEGSGPPLVLIHPFGMNLGVWDEVAPALARRMTVVRFDLRGMGASSVPAGPYLMETLASDLAAVLDTLRIERATVVGNSMDVMVCFAFFRLFNERVAGLGLVCGRAGADDEQAAAWRNELADRAEREGIAPIVEAMYPRYLAPQAYARRPELAARVRTMLEATDQRGAAAMLRGMSRRTSSEDLLDDIAVPVVAIGGLRDAFTPPGSVRAMASRIADAQFYALDCCHVPQLEAPDDFLGALDPLLTVAAL